MIAKPAEPYYVNHPEFMSARLQIVLPAIARLCLAKSEPHAHLRDLHNAEKHGP